MAAPASLAAAEALAAHDHQHRNFTGEYFDNQSVEPLQHRRALIGHMLFDRSAEGEMPSARIDQNPAQCGIVGGAGKLVFERDVHRGVENIGLGTIEAQPQKAAIAFDP